MNLFKFKYAFIALSILFWLPETGFAESSMPGKINSAIRQIYNNNSLSFPTNCTTCHETNAGTFLNDQFGFDISNSAVSSSLSVEVIIQRWQMYGFLNWDSDGDGCTNGDEFQASTNPADISSRPSSCPSKVSGGDGGEANLTGGTPKTTGSGDVGGGLCKASPNMQSSEASFSSHFIFLLFLFFPLLVNILVRRKSQ